jgi:hypothetical protein
MDSNGKRLQIPAAKSLALINAQVVTGESLRKAAASSTGLAELRVVGPRMSSWSGANKRALVKIFGPAEEETYRASARVEISGRSFASQQARLIRKADSQLGYLRAALVRVAQAAASEATTGQEVPATQDGGSKLAMLDQRSVHQDAAGKAIEPRKPKRSWRELLLNVWTVGVGAPLIVAGLIAGLSEVVSVINGNNALLTGSVVCPPGQQVVGIWIAASTGQRDSGYAHLGTVVAAAGNYPEGPTATYSFSLQNGITYSVHVGCGGSVNDWEFSDDSPLLSTRSVTLHCTDPLPTYSGNASLKGICAATATT